MEGAQIKDLNNRRSEKQPLEYPSAGSTFKRPEGYFAGKLIDDAGLRGFRLGGAAVSQKHCGFVINYDNASSDDIKKLIEHIKKEVCEKFGVKLECEVSISIIFSISSICAENNLQAKSLSRFNNAFVIAYKLLCICFP